MLISATIRSFSRLAWEVPCADRAERIINRRTATLRNRSEQELAGYRDAQDYLFQPDWVPLNAGLILHVHRLLFAHTAMPGGAFKTEDNLVVDRSPDGSTTVRFKPVPAAVTPFAIDDLIDRYLRAVVAGEHHPVLLSGLFILDLLIRAGRRRIGGRLADPWPWLGYFTGLIADAYTVFSDRAAAAKAPGTKQQRIREHILGHAPLTFRLADIRTAVPGVSDQTIRLVLEQLKDEGKVRADGTGRAATWTRTTTAPST